MGLSCPSHTSKCVITICDDWLSYQSVQIIEISIIVGFLLDDIVWLHCPCVYDLFFSKNGIIPCILFLIFSLLLWTYFIVSEYFCLISFLMAVKNSMEITTIFKSVTYSMPFIIFLIFHFCFINSTIENILFFKYMCKP